MSEWHFVQIFDELEHYDIHFEIFNPWDYLTYDEANIALVSKLKGDDHYDLFMNCASSEMLYESTMSELKSIDIPKLLICFDNLHAPYMHRSIAPHFDLAWLTSWETETMFKKWGCKTIFLPYASNPFAFRDMYEKSIDKVCFVGTPYGTRTMMFNTLLQDSISVDVFCKRNKQNGIEPIKTIEKKKAFSKIKTLCELSLFPIGRKVVYSGIKINLIKPQSLIDSTHLTMMNQLSNEEMNRAYSNYALSLNVITLRNTAVLNHPVQKLHLRTFEIPMCAGLELVEYNQELFEYFSEDEMVFYKDKEEMVDKARFFTKPQNENIVREMKMRARRKAENEHTWMKRFSKAFDELGLKY